MEGVASVGCLLLLLGAATCGAEVSDCAEDSGGVRSLGGVTASSSGVALCDAGKSAACSGSGDSDRNPALGRGWQRTYCAKAAVTLHHDRGRGEAGGEPGTAARLLPGGGCMPCTARGWRC